MKEGTSVSTAEESAAEKRRRRGVAVQNDRAIGARLREAREMAGFSRHDLGDKLGLTFQQIQKYERGLNRVGSGRLAHIAGILKTPLLYFFQDVLEEGVPDEPSESKPEPAVSAEGYEIANAFDLIPDWDAKEHVRRLVLSLGREIGEGRATSSSSAAER